MADPRFFRAAGPFTVDQIAALSECKLAGAARSDLVLHDVADLGTAGPTDLSFLSNPRYLDRFSESRAGAIFVGQNHADRAPSGATLLIASDPYLAYARAAQAFYPVERAADGVASSAVIDETAILGRNVTVGPNAVVEAGAEIGSDTEIGPCSVIGRNVRIGRACRIGANVSVRYSLIGDRVMLYPGVRLGQDGFGFAPSATGHVKIPQLGRVIIEDDVEIGANSAVDRGAGPDTVIGRGCMIDNLVQIGHNVSLGRGCVIAGLTAIGGSTSVGDFVMIGGGAALAGHLTIGAGARIAGKSGVMRDVPAGVAVSGSPAVPVKQFFRQAAILARLAAGKEE